MEHYVQYHNPDLIGTSVWEVASAEAFEIGTNKNIKKLTGNRIWLVGGDGRPRKYYLCYTFIADSVDEPEDDLFRFTISGTEGRRFIPPYELSGEPWFYDFLKNMVNFSLGLRKIPENYIAMFERIAEDRSQAGEA